MVWSQLSVTSESPSPQDAFQHTLTTSQDPFKHWDPASNLETWNQGKRKWGIILCCGRSPKRTTWRKINMHWLTCESVPLRQRCINIFYHLWRCFHIIVIEKNIFVIIILLFFFLFARSSCKKAQVNWPASQKLWINFFNLHLVPGKCSWHFEPCTHKQ